MIKWIVCLLVGGIMGLHATETLVGFGTYPLRGQACTKAVEEAIECGYSVIDTATYYKNFDAIAKALKGKDRSRLYLISKVWHDKQAPSDLKEDLEWTLKELQTDYLDLYFLHWPNSKIPIEETLRTLEELRVAKKIREIGLSNVSINHVKRALEVGVPIGWVQVEMNPYFYDPELLKFCKEQGIGVQAWAPIGRGRIANDPMLARIGKKYGKTPVQVALKWVVQHDCLPLPGSQNPKHIRENVDINDFTLSAEEMTEIDQRAKLGQRERFSNKTLGLEDEFDFSYEQCWTKESVYR